MLKFIQMLIFYDDTTNTYIGFIPNIPGAHTQGNTLSELLDNMKEVLELSLEEKQKADYLLIKEELFNEDIEKIYENIKTFTTP